MPRLRGYRDSVQHDYHVHISELEYDSKYGPWGFRRIMPMISDQTLVVYDVAASREDITIVFEVGTRDCLTVTGPWLTKPREALIVQLMQVAYDAIQEGKVKSAMEVIAEVIEKGPSRASGILRPLIVPVRQNWGLRVRANEGSKPGPVDIWIRTLLTRDVG